MPTFDAQLEIQRCPYCFVDQPNLPRIWSTDTSNFRQGNKRLWNIYACIRCGGLILAASIGEGEEIAEMYPSLQVVMNDKSIPTRARDYLNQAISSINAPAGAVMLAASSIDAMLKAKGYKEGKLYHRIEKAVKDHLITEDMGKWAHHVRLDANEQRHADDEIPIATEEEAKTSIEFAKALGMFLFILPAMVTKGIAKAENINPQATMFQKTKE